ncbi:YbaN family protein [Neisseria leonii]|uniref:YbaN family protein n=1 Tax=Neisseria leonii TaxID=2995413 RepID=A0A9X4E110_9NEIS|nr:YbaN family protein [Neisseria sp. 51.81]MDD9327044.1 YbaN family protein [Neisseria sp. 51.81]
MWRALLWLAGALALALGIIGIYLPLLPTTPLVLLAALCWARASPRLHRFLLQHRRFGPILHNWESRRAVPRRAKYLAYIMMTFSCALLWWRFGTQSWYFPAAASLICAATAIWMSRLPDA